MNFKILGLSNFFTFVGSVFKRYLSNLEAARRPDMWDHFVKMVEKLKKFKTMLKGS